MPNTWHHLWTVEAPLPSPPPQAMEGKSFIGRHPKILYLDEVSAEQ